LVLIAPSPVSAASKSDGVRNAAGYEVGSRRYYRRHVYVRPAYRSWRRAAYWGGPRWGWGGYARPWRTSYAYGQPWGWGGGYYQPLGWRGAYAAAPGWGVGFYRPWRPWGWGWGRGFYRPWGGWGWGPRWGSVGFWW
jgi:hypothetical protein